MVVLGARLGGRVAAVQGEPVHQEIRPDIVGQPLHGRPVPAAPGVAPVPLTGVTASGFGPLHLHARHLVAQVAGSF